VSATVRSHSARNRFCSPRLVNLRPATALFWANLTPDSILPLCRGIAGFVAESGQIVNLADAYKDERFDRSFDQSSGYRTKSLLALPVKDRNGRIVGVLQLLNNKGGPFTQDDIAALEDISVHAALALENARLHHESKERQRLERELALAKEIQRRLLPDAPPKVEGFDFAVRHQSSLHVGGDYYDFIEIDPMTQLFVVADVEGKGASSALIMSNLQATLHAVANHVHSIEGIVFHLNQGIQLSTRGQKYMTLFLGLIDVRRRALHYINAGHVPPVVVRADGSSLPLEEGGMVLGMFESVPYAEGIVELRSGDTLFIYSDGVTETFNPEGEEYGEERLMAAVKRCRGSDAATIQKTILSDLDSFAQGIKAGDDRTIIVLKRD